MSKPPGAVVVSLRELENGFIPFEVLEEAFGPSSLGILLVKDLPTKFPVLRHKLLSYGSYLANLSSEELDTLTFASANYLTGWSHGKEALKTGIYDTLKGSYYVNCAFYQDSKSGSVPHQGNEDAPEYTARNVWPPEQLLPGFRQTFEELCTLIIDVAALVARACDRYALANIEGYEDGYLERVVKTSMTTKARLLHYFPPEASNEPAPEIASGEKPSLSNEDAINDSWCASHIDHGCLTGLTSALYVDEAAHDPRAPEVEEGASALPPLPALPSPPSPSTGLYIKSRTSAVIKVQIPPSCLGFQTGEALQLITGGKFRAVPHFVRAGSGREGGSVARNTLAVFTQPNLGEIVDRERGLTFAEFAKEVAGRFG